METAYLTGGLALALGLLLAGRAAPRLARALRFKLQRGKPYVPGSLRQAALALLLGLALAVAGAGVAGARWLLRDYQRAGDGGEAARMRVTGEVGSLLLELESRGASGRRSLRAIGLTGSAWQVRGVVISFPSWSGRLGLGAFHRILDAGDPTAPGADAPGMDAAAARLALLPPWLGVQVETRALAGAGPLPEWTGVRATGDGYLLGALPDDPPAP